MTKLKIAFVTNFCSHYRVKTFETLAGYYDVDYYFYSAGDEWYWQRQHGTQSGNFKHVYLPGFRLGNTRITPTLLKKLFFGNYDLYIKCINGKFALPITFLTAWIKKRPFILWTGIWMRLQTRTHRILWPLTYFIYKHSNAIVTYGEHVKAYLISEGISPEKIFVANHAVDNEVYSIKFSEEQKETIRRKLDIEPSKKIILYLGRLEESKGISYLIESLSQLKEDDVVLVIAGSGSEETRLRNMVDVKGLTRYVRFVGYVPIEWSSLFYSIAYVLVLPSITMPYGKEPWGLVVNEAFNQGVPVVVTNAVGAAAGGLVEDGVNGLVVPERNSEALRGAIKKIIDNPTLRVQLSKNAIEKIRKWDNENMISGFISAINYVLSQREE